MSVKKKSKGNSALNTNVIVTDMRSHENDPFVIKKVDRAKGFLRQHPIPEHILKKYDSK